jgi:hypothetical protein
MYLLLIMIKTLHFLGTLASFNCLGTLASQQLTNTLFNMGLKTRGVTGMGGNFSICISSHSIVPYPYIECVEDFDLMISPHLRTSVAMHGMLLFINVQCIVCNVQFIK